MTCRVQALLLFASLAAPPFNHERHLPQLEGSGIKDLITLLVSLATLEAEDGDLSSVTSAAQLATTKVINAISAGEFLLAVTVTLRSTEPRVGPQLSRWYFSIDGAIQVKIGGLESLTARISLVSEIVRQEHKTTMVKAINRIDDIITRQSAGALVEAALAALKAIASTHQSGEDAALQATLPHVMKVIRSRSSVAAALAILPSYMYVAFTMHVFVLRKL